VPDGIGGVIVGFRIRADTPKAHKTVNVEIESQIASMKDRSSRDGRNLHGVEQKNSTTKTERNETIAAD
jgi:hypothetical protein